MTMTTLQKILLVAAAGVILHDIVTKNNSDSYDDDIDDEDDDELNKNPASLSQPSQPLLAPYAGFLPVSPYAQPSPYAQAYAPPQYAPQTEQRKPVSKELRRKRSKIAKARPRTEDGKFAPSTKVEQPSASEIEVIDEKKKLKPKKPMKEYSIWNTDED